MVKVSFTPIVPKGFDARAFSAAANKVLKDEARQIKREFNKTTKTFRHRVTFAEKNTSTNRQLSRLVFTSNKPYFFVVRGTSKRYAIMTSDFSAKTSVRVIGSKRGSGKVAIVLSPATFRARGMTPRPGIKARDFDEVIVKLRQPQFERAAIRAFARAARQANR